MIRTLLRSALRFAATGLVVLVMASGAQARSVSLHSGEHLNSGRIIVEAGTGMSYHVSHVGDRVTISFGKGVALGETPQTPRNVQSVVAHGQTLELTLAPGARFHSSRAGGRLYLDFADPVVDAKQPEPQHPNAPPANAGQAADAGQAAKTASPANAAASPNATQAANTVPPAKAAMPPAAASTAASTAAHPPEPAEKDSAAAPQAAPSAPASESTSQTAAAPSSPAPVAPAAPPAPATEISQELQPGRDVAPEAAEEPMTLLARRVRMPQGAPGSGMLLPFGQNSGAAMFPDGSGTVLVFDERRPIDMSALHDDPVFGGVTIRLLPSGTLVHIPSQPGLLLSLAATARGWRVFALPAIPKPQPITVDAKDGAVALGAAQPGEVLTLADSKTGATLLVGTVRHPGQAIMFPRATPDFELRPTGLGVVVEAKSKQLALRTVPTGFKLTGGPGGLNMGPSIPLTNAQLDASHLTRRFNFANARPDGAADLARELQQAAAAPPLARGAFNRRLGETMLTLGMGAEAQGVLQLAAEQDPTQAASPDTAALGAIGALLAGRVTEADALTDKRLDGSDEVALWRAIREAMLDRNSPAAATVFRATAPLALLYPEAMRNHILPLIMETMIQGGQVDAARQWLSQPQLKDDPKLAYARALLHQAEGDTDGALAILDTLANSPDQFDRARAAVQAVELRLAAKKLTTEQAADALDKLLYVWRGDGRELALRERLSDLRSQTGRWREALTILRNSVDDFPDQADALRARMRDAFSAMLHDPKTQHMAPLEFAALVDENADLLRDLDGTDEINQKLAEDYVALDLPKRAEPLLQRLVRGAPSNLDKARYAQTLARLYAHDADTAGVLATLSQYSSQNLPADMAEDDAVLRANAMAQGGQATAAVALLAPFHSARVLETRAGILEATQDWAGAEQAWRDDVALKVPAQGGTLDDTQTRTLLRLATATARAKDDAGLTALHDKYDGRFGPGPMRDMFRLLTAAPVQSTKDLGRSGAETELAAKLPTDLAALKGVAAAH